MFKTIISVWTQEENILFLADGDHRGLDGVTINTIAIDGLTAEDLDDESNRKYVEENPNNTKANQEALCNVLLDEKGRYKYPKFKSANVSQEIRQGAEFISVGLFL